MHQQQKLDKIIKAPTFQFPQRQFQIQQILCEGSEGVVYSAIPQNCNLNQRVALKIHHKATCLSKDYRNFLNQIKQNPQNSIIKVYDFFESDEGFTLIMELGQLDLQKFMKQNAKLDLKHKMYISQQIIQSIKYLHDKNQIHRDIKPENFIIIDDYKVKLIDFGIIRQDEIGKTMTQGTSQYMAPEVSEGEYCVKADIWSLGCLLYEIYVGKQLFECSSIKQLNAKLDSLKNNSQQELALLYQTQLSQQMKNLIHRMLNWTPEKRPDINETLKCVIENKYTSNCFVTLLELAEKNEIFQLIKDVQIYYSATNNPDKYQKLFEQLTQSIGILHNVNPHQFSSLIHHQRHNLGTEDVDQNSNNQFKHIKTDLTPARKANYINNQNVSNQQQIIFNAQNKPNQINFQKQNQINQLNKDNLPQKNNFQVNNNFKPQVINSPQANFQNQNINFVSQQQNLQSNLNFNKKQ